MCLPGLGTVKVGYIRHVMACMKDDFRLDWDTCFDFSPSGIQIRSIAAECLFLVGTLQYSVYPVV
jgi:hypothetical protein